MILYGDKDDEQNQMVPIVRVDYGVKWKRTVMLKTT